MLNADFYNELYRTMGMVLRKKRLLKYNSMENIAQDLNMKVQQYGKYEIGRKINTNAASHTLPKTPPYFSVRSFAKRSGRQFEYGRLDDKSGWYARRVK